jgi:hypothetical protein
VPSLVVASSRRIFASSIWYPSMLSSKCICKRMRKASASAP